MAFNLKLCMSKRAASPQTAFEPSPSCYVWLCLSLRCKMARQNTELTRGARWGMETTPLRMSGFVSRCW